MTGSGARAQELDCVVVGGGLAGLSCAHDLARAGRSVHVVEAEEAPGGRARTVWHRGRPVDRGFQVLFRAYPRTRALLRAIGIPRRDLRPVGGGAVFVNGSGTHRLGTSRLAVAGFTGLAPPDRAKLMRLAVEVAARPPQSLLDDGEDAGSTEDFLRERGFSDEAIERFFRPLFGVVLLDRSLSADAGYFRFLLAMLARGPAVIPSDGLGMVAEWTTAAIRQAGGMVELGVRVAALEPDAQGRRVQAVLMEDGRRLSARQVVLAVEAPAARGLLTPLDPAAAGAPADRGRLVGGRRLRAADAPVPRSDHPAERRPGVRGAAAGRPAVPDDQHHAPRGGGGTAHPAGHQRHDRRRPGRWPRGRRGGARAALGARLRLGGPRAADRCLRAPLRAVPARCRGCAATCPDRARPSRTWSWRAISPGTPRWRGRSRAAPGPPRS